MIIAFSNHKGGTTKTTSCASISVALAELGKKVLAVDLDPQGSLTITFGKDPDKLENTIYNALLDKGTSIKDAILKIKDNLDLAPANRDLAAAEILLFKEAGSEFFLSQAIKKIKGSYDFILIDCPPSLGKLTINALTACQKVIIPLPCSFLAIKSLGQLLDTIEVIKERLNSNLEIMGILLSKIDSRTLHSKEVEERIRDIFKDKVFKTTVSQTVRFEEAPAQGQTILEYAPTHKSAEAYREITKEVLNHG